MDPPDQSSPANRVRREPPQFRLVRVDRIEHLSPRLIRVTLAGSELDDLTGQPAASVRLLLPDAGTQVLVLPSWNGNEFLHPDEVRPTIRTFTPLPGDSQSLALAIVVHPGGVASRWAEAAKPGDPAAVSGPGRGYAIDPEATSYLLAGDETAIPAIGQLLGVLPATIPVRVHLEITDPDARIALPVNPRASLSWHELPPGADAGDALTGAVLDARLDSGLRIWVAGEAAAVQRIRRHLFHDRGFPRSRASVRGYWKRGRAGPMDDA